LSDDDLDAMSSASLDLMEQIRPLLAGKGAEVQSAVLADLTSMVLAGMFLMDRRSGQINRKATDAMRAVALKAFIKTVKELIPVNEEIITKPILDRKRMQ
jgi:hypothetical protein